MNPSQCMMIHTDVYLLSHRTMRDMACGITANVPGSEALRDGQPALLQARVSLRELTPEQRQALVDRMEGPHALGKTMQNALCLYAAQLDAVDAIEHLQNFLRACADAVQRDRERAQRNVELLSRVFLDNDSSLRKKLRARKLCTVHDLLALDRKTVAKLLDAYQMHQWNELQRLRPYLPAA